jgi:hypothetical protein
MNWNHTFQKYPSDPNAIYRTFVRTGKIGTRRTQGDWCFLVGETTTLLDRYQHGLQLALQGSQYRDALIDAMVEMMDDYGREPPWERLLHATEGHEMCPMWRFIGFFYSLIALPCYFNGMEQMGNEKIWRCWRGEFKRLPKGKTTREVWEEFLEKDRCRFHEHGNNRCWRSKGSTERPRSLL